MTGRGITRVLDKVAELYDKHAGRIPTGELNRFLGELQGGAPAAVARPQAAEPALRRAGHDAPAALPLHRQRHEPRHARLRLLGRERAARAVRARGRPGRDRLPAAVVRDGGRRRRRLVGHGLLAAARRPRATRSRSRRSSAEDARAIRETGRNPRFLPRGRPRRRRRDDDRRGAGRGRRAVVVAVPSRAFRSVVEALPGDAPVLSLTKGLDPETGERLSTLVARPPGRRALGPEHGRGGRGRACRARP